MKIIRFEGGPADGHVELALPDFVQFVTVQIRKERVIITFAGPADPKITNGYTYFVGSDNTAHYQPPVSVEASSGGQG